MLVLKRINFPVLLLSFGLALLLWMHVKNVSDPTGSSTGPSSFSVDLELRNQPQGTVIVGDIPSNVTFTAVGPIEEQRKINISYLKAFVDLAEPPRQGRYRVRLETTADYRVQWQPEDLRIPILLEKEVTRRINVEVEAIGDFKLQDYRFDRATSEPSSISIRGASSQVEKVKRARAYLNLTALESDNSQRAKVELLDDKDSPVANVSLSTDVVTVRAIVLPRPPRRSLLIQPEWLGYTVAGTTMGAYAFTPREVEVVGPADVLANLEIVRTKPINLEGLSQTTTIPVELNLPPGVVLAKPETVSVKIFVKKDQEPPNTTGGQ